MECKNCGKESNINCACGYCLDCARIKHPDMDYDEWLLNNKEFVQRFMNKQPPQAAEERK